MKKPTPSSSASAALESKQKSATPETPDPGEQATDPIIRLISCRPSKRRIFDDSTKAPEDYKGFRFPNADLIQGRSSTIAKSFARSLTPRINPSMGELDKFEEIFGVAEKTCVYCGEASNTWDHFVPLVSGSAPTGYIDELDNLVPSCTDCNSLKGNNTWQDFMDHKQSSPAITMAKKVKAHHATLQSPPSVISDALHALELSHQKRRKALETFDALADPLCIDLKELYDTENLKEKYEEWLALEKEILEALKKAIPLLNELRPEIWKKTKELEEKRDGRKAGEKGYGKDQPPSTTLRTSILKTP